MIDFMALAAPFPPSSVSWRVGSTTSDKKRGMALAFIDARDVMDRLDTVCGPAGWQCDYPHANGKTVCRIGIKVGEDWVWKADGAGDTDVEAEKGALSDAFKRAAVRWGIGRYLYDIPSPWVELEAAGRSYKIPDGELKRLAAMLDGKGAPAPVAKQAPPVDAKAVEMDILDAIAIAQDDDHLQRIRTDPEFKAGYRQLGEEAQSRVQTALRHKRDALRQEAA